MSKQDVANAEVAVPVADLAILAGAAIAAVDRLERSRTGSDPFIADFITRVREADEKARAAVNSAAATPERCTCGAVIRRGNEQGAFVGALFHYFNGNACGEPADPPWLAPDHPIQCRACGSLVRGDHSADCPDREPEPEASAAANRP